MSLTFSVIIPSRNRASLVQRAIRSALNQERPALEVIVVDDGSEDETGSVVKELFPTVRYLRQESNLGVGAARNRGLEAARGDWGQLLDDCDTQRPETLPRIPAPTFGFPRL